MNEKQAVAILMGNLKGSKNKPTNLLRFSNACDLLIKKWGIKEVARHFDTSQYMLRQIEKIKKLDPDTKKYIRMHELGIEKSYHLWRLDEKKRSEILPYIKNLSSDDVRNLVYLIRHDPSKSVKECMKIFEEKYAKKATVMVLALPTDVSNRLKRISKEKKMKPVEYVRHLIEVATDE